MGFLGVVKKLFGFLRLGQLCTGTKQLPSREAKLLCEGWSEGLGFVAKMLWFIC